MFNRSNIMKAAWLRYRQLRAQYAPWQIKRGIVDASFSRCLKTAWRIAKQEAANRATAEAAVAANGSRAADRVRELTSELMRIDARPWGMRSFRVAGERTAIQSEISKLRGAFA